MPMQSCKLEYPDELRKSVREQVEQGLLSGYTEQFLDFETITPYPVGIVGMPDYNFFPEFSGHMWYNQMQQGSQHGGVNCLRQSDDKLQPFGSWNVCGNDSRGHQGSSVMVRQTVLGGTNQFGIAQNGTCAGQNAGRVGSAQLQHSGMFQKMENSREDSMRVSTPVHAGSQQKQLHQQHQIAQRQQQQQQQHQQQQQQQPHHPQQQVSKQNNNKKQQGSNLAVSVSSAGSTCTTAVTSTAPVDTKPLPAFEQAFGSTEIGRFSHEGFFSSMQQQLQQQQQQQQVQQQQQQQQQQQHQQQLLQQQQQVPETESIFSTKTSSLSAPLHDDYNGLPPFTFSPPPAPPTNEKLEATDMLLSPSNWPSLFYYTPGGMDPWTTRPTNTFFDYGIPNPGLTCGGDTSFVLGPDTSTSEALQPLLCQQENSAEHDDQIEKQDVVISELKLKEHTVISENDRICVIKESDITSVDNSELPLL